MCCDTLRRSLVAYRAVVTMCVCNMCFMYVGMYVCMCVMYVCMHVCRYVMYACMNVCMYVIYACIYVCM